MKTILSLCLIFSLWRVSPSSAGSFHNIGDARLFIHATGDTSASWYPRGHIAIVGLSADTAQVWSFARLAHRLNPRWKMEIEAGGSFNQASDNTAAVGVRLYDSRLFAQMQYWVKWRDLYQYFQYDRPLVKSVAIGLTMQNIIPVNAWPDAMWSMEGHLVYRLGRMDLQAGLVRTWFSDDGKRRTGWAHRLSCSLFL